MDEKETFEFKFSQQGPFLKEEGVDRWTVNAGVMASWHHRYVWLFQEILFSSY